MATPLDDGKIYFVESDAGDNQDWITADAGDPDDIDLDSFTEGTEYCQLDLPTRWTKTWTTGIVVTDSSGGSSFDFRSNRKGYNMLPQSFKTSIANANLVEKFFMIDRHTSGASATFVEYYMIIRFGASSYAEFIDGSDNSKEYCPVRVLLGKTTWSEDSPQTMNVSLNVRSIW